MSYQNEEKKQPLPTYEQARNIVYMAVQQPQVGPDPTHMICPHCHVRITSMMEKQPSTKTHLFFILLCALGCICCAPFVYCTDSCLAKKHSCPNCHMFLGMYDN